MKTDVKASQNGNGKVTDVKPSTNGNGKGTDLKVSGDGETKPPVTASPVVEEKREAPKPQPTGIEAALGKVERLSNLALNREKVCETLSKLKGFRPEMSESNTTLVLSDNTGRKFTTTNSEHIGAVMGRVIEICEGKKADFEKEITELAA